MKSADFARVVREYAEKGYDLIVGVGAVIPIPDVNRLANAFCVGAEDVNEAVKCEFLFIGSFFDPPKAKEVAIAQIEAGADVLFAERFGVVEAGVYTAQDLGGFSLMGGRTSPLVMRRTPSRPPMSRP
ncbi:BMP family ABC transporter substrate-binding protein [Varunaivibrio sulfuroxidans]|uniref:Basic membrane protein n=1 Tax=Varunaivibrio sulfuroxidans TaxID=1773489 RepID=A0A4R3J8G1_9PROT|nr:BMP family ABC transporter substrate-binding protein [Varunaivibrio sulfuroxidans]TCS61772.1 basic membrane protein [Varunaivibrio sulfuroxidans]WES32044.1 BMP family ABC transporter substrate-binding protein [Varunaivibrio sulfuroxidans]